MYGRTSRETWLMIRMVQVSSLKTRNIQLDKLGHPIDVTNHNLSKLLSKTTKEEDGGVLACGRRLANLIKMTYSNLMDTPPKTPTLFAAEPNKRGL